MTVNTTYSKTRRTCAHCSLLKWIISSATSTLTGLKMGIVRVELKCKSSTAKLSAQYLPPPSLSIQRSLKCWNLSNGSRKKAFSLRHPRSAANNQAPARSHLIQKKILTSSQFRLEKMSHGCRSVLLLPQLTCMISTSLHAHLPLMVCNAWKRLYDKMIPHGIAQNVKGPSPSEITTTFSTSSCTITLATSRMLSLLTRPQMAS